MTNRGTLFPYFEKIRQHSTKTNITYFLDEIIIYEVMQKHLSSQRK